ncbi:hypothetical protein GRJ2_002402900 [Grus japonensis]|uniref:Uncharacterized protein n=1 Tax=Grus japonensis TaxID=30415 RepID=A0ABC9XNT8_GRUJA
MTAAGVSLWTEQVGRKDGSPKRRRPGAAGSLGGAKPRADEQFREGATRDDGCRGQSLDRAGEEGPDDCRKIPVSRCTICRERGSAPKSSTGGEQSAVRRCKGGYGPRRTQTREVTRARWGARTAAQNDGGQVPQGASEGRSRVPTSSQRRRCVATFWTGCPFEVPRGMTAAGVSLWTEQVKRVQTTAGRSQCRERGSAPKSSTGGEQSAVRRCKGGYGPRRTQTREVTRARWGARTAAQNDGGQVPQGASEGRSRVPTSSQRRRCVATFWTGCPFEVPRGMTAAGVSLWTEQMQRERKRTKEQHRRGAERRKEVLQVRTAAGSISGPSS